MTELMYEDITISELEEELKGVIELIHKCSLTEDLITLEQEIGLSDFIGATDWKELTRILWVTKSPYYQTYVHFCEKWDELEEQYLPIRWRHYN